MRLLRINGSTIELDDDTAIGITKQSYNLKTPGVRLTNLTNTFTIPITSKNLYVFGNPNDPQSISTKAYELLKADYWVDNEQLLDDVYVQVVEIQDRISLFTYEKDDIWDELKNVKWADFVKDFITWLQDERGYPSFENPYIGSFTDFIKPFSTNTEELLLPHFLGNLYDYADPEGEDSLFEDATGGGYVEDYRHIWLKFWPSNSPKADGGRFMVYFKTIFEYIEDTYEVSFITEGSGAVGNVWDDSVAVAAYTPIRAVNVRHYYEDAELTGFYFAFEDSPSFLPLDGQKDKNDKTLYDCVQFFMHHLNIILDDVKVNGESAIRMARFDDIETLAEIVDWSGGLDGKTTPKWKPSFGDDFAQSNYIKFSSIYEYGDSELGMRTLTCGNLNLKSETDLFEIDGYINSYLAVDGGSAPDLSPTESFGAFSFFISSGETASAVNIHTSEMSETYETAYLKLQLPILYSLENEYNLYDSMLTYPKYFSVKKWLTFNDIKDLTFFKQYYIKELGGSFFLQKISGFNPQKSNEATTIELVKIGNATPTPNVDDAQYWVDGVGNIFEDGEGNSFY